MERSGNGDGPRSWEDVLKIGKKIKDTKNIPVGVGMSAELDTAMAMRTLLYAWGGSVQAKRQDHPRFEADRRRGEVRHRPLQADDDARGDGLGCVVEQPGAAGRQDLDVLNAISTTRTAENEKLPIADQFGLTKALMGAKRAIGLET